MGITIHFRLVLLILLMLMSGFLCGAEGRIDSKEIVGSLDWWIFVFIYLFQNIHSSSLNKKVESSSSKLYY